MGVALEHRVCRQIIIFTRYVRANKREAPQTASVWYTITCIRGVRNSYRHEFKWMRIDFQRQRKSNHFDRRRREKVSYYRRMISAHKPCIRLIGESNSEPNFKLLFRRRHGTGRYSISLTSYQIKFIFLQQLCALRLRFIVDLHSDNRFWSVKIVTNETPARNSKYSLVSECRHPHGEKLPRETEKSKRCGMKNQINNLQW